MIKLTNRKVRRIVKKLHQECWTDKVCGNCMKASIGLCPNEKANKIEQWWSIRKN